MPQDSSVFPDFREWQIAAVRLLQGVVSADDAPVWSILLSNRSKLEEYLGRLGLQLNVNEDEGFSYLQHLDEDELPPGYERLPRLFHKARLSYDATLLAVVLRDELRRFDEEELHDERCVVSKAGLFELWKAYFPSASDEVRLNAALDKALTTLEDMKFIKQFSKEPAEWSVQRVLKARLPVEKLEKLLETLTTVAAAGKGPEKR